MHPRLQRTLTVGRAVLYEVRTERLTFMAGSIAYHAFVSLLPLLLLALAVISSVGSATLEESFIQFTRTVLTEGASNVLVSELLSARESTGISLFGFVVLVWGTLRIFRGLDTAFSDIYESEAENTFADQLSDGVLVLVAFGLAVAVALAIESFVTIRGNGLLAWSLRRLMLVFGLSLALFPIYYVFPDEDLGVVEVLPGVALAAVGLTAFESLFGLYVSFRGVGGGSVVAGILVLLTWLYFSGLVILLGASVNAVLSNRSSDVNIRPVFGGIAVDEKSVSASRDDVVDALTVLDHLLDDADDLTVTVDGTEVTLPRPDNVVTKTETSKFFLGGPVSIELRWSPRED